LEVYIPSGHEVEETVDSNIIDYLTNNEGKEVSAKTLNNLMRYHFSKRCSVWAIIDNPLKHMYPKGQDYMTLEGEVILIPHIKSSNKYVHTDRMWEIINKKFEPCQFGGVTSRGHLIFKQIVNDKNRIVISQKNFCYAIGAFGINLSECKFGCLGSKSGNAIKIEHGNAIMIIAPIIMTAEENILDDEEMEKFLLKWFRLKLKDNQKEQITIARKKAKSWKGMVRNPKPPKKFKEGQYIWINRNLYPDKKYSGEYDGKITKYKYDDDQGFWIIFTDGENGNEGAYEYFFTDDINVSGAPKPMSCTDKKAFARKRPKRWKGMVRNPKSIFSVGELVVSKGNEDSRWTRIPLTIVEILWFGDGSPFYVVEDELGKKSTWSEGNLEKYIDPKDPFPIVRKQRSWKGIVRNPGASFVDELNGAEAIHKLMKAMNWKDIPHISQIVLDGTGNFYQIKGLWSSIYDLASLELQVYISLGANPTKKMVSFGEFVVSQDWRTNYYGQHITGISPCGQTGLDTVKYWMWLENELNTQNAQTSPNTQTPPKIKRRSKSWKGVVRNPVVVTVPHKCEKIAREVAHAIEDGVYKTFINTHMSRKKHDYNRKKSRNRRWRKDVSKALKKATIVLDLHDSNLGVDKPMIFESANDWNNEFIHKLADMVGAELLPVDSKNDILDEAESKGIHSAVIEFDRGWNLEKIREESEKLMGAISQLDKFDVNPPKNGKVCIPCKKFYTNPRKIKCDSCGKSLSKRKNPPLSYIIV